MPISKDEILVWVKALESGDYPQTEGVMKYKDANNVASYCCLGVLAEIMGTPAHSVNAGVLATDNIENMNLYSLFHIEIPQCDNYIDMNDEGCTFDEIATQIRKDYKL